MVKRVLMLAFHFPPQRGSSGIQRTLKFVRHLPALGWQPLVLSAHPRAYENTGADQLGEIPGTVPVRRAFALDSARHLAVRGRYPGLLALPDRWASWLLGAVPAGLAIVRRMRPALIWSTYPIATAHLAAFALHRLTGLPWVADLRDPMIDASHPSGRLRRAAAAWVEARVVRHAARVVVTTPGALRSYRARYPAAPPERFRLIENGYDEEAFTNLAPATPGKPFTLLHSGVIYPSERDPGPLFEALAALRARGLIAPATFRLRLRAPAHEALLRGMAERYGLADLIEILPHLPYRAALAEMLGADGLLVLQAANCNDQVPAKLYEYLRAGRPILALTDPAGDTAGLLRGHGIDTIARLDDSGEIATGIARFLELAASGRAPRASSERVRAAERRQRTAQLADLLDEVALEAPAGRRQAA
jgi:glycosyltransferase involved in cell wall biosynthesis